MIRAPDFERDGWCLEDGEQRHAEAPKTFEIPELEVRKILQPGDFAKLIFRISLFSESEPFAIERMWVIVRERIPNGYIGMLDNEPTAIRQNRDFWWGSELPFEARHIISVSHANDQSIAIANQPPPIPWDRN